MKIGNIIINDLKLGNTQIQKVMLGSNLVWEKNINFLTNLVAYYPLNSNVSDFSGNNNNGTQINSPTYTSSKVSYGINFGNDDIMRHFEIVDSDDLSFTDGISDIPFSISMWVNFTSFNTVGNWLINKRGASNGTDEWQIIYYQNRLTFYKFNFNNNSIFQQISSNLSPFSLNTWYHISYTDDGSGVIGSGKLYINGIDVTSLNQNVGGIYSRMNNSNSIVKVGINAWSPLTTGLKHKGLIDEVAIWKNRELTPREVLELYNIGNLGTPIVYNTLQDNLVAYYPFEGNGNDMVNYYNGSYNSSVVGFTTGKNLQGASFIKNINSKITIPNNGDLSFTTGVNDLPFTISLWVKINSTGNHFLIMKYLNADTNSEWAFYIVSNKIRGLIMDKNTNNTYILKETTLVLNNLQLYHLCLTYDGVNGYNGMKIYVNGIQQTCINLSLGTYTGMKSGLLPMTIGNSSQTTINNNVTDGVIDELAIWKNRELMVTEVLELYNSGLGKFYPF